jgi:hypothetical protein
MSRIIIAWISANLMWITLYIYLLSYMWSTAYKSVITSVDIAIFILHKPYNYILNFANFMRNILYIQQYILTPNRTHCACAHSVRVGVNLYCHNIRTYMEWTVLNIVYSLFAHMWSTVYKSIIINIDTQIFILNESYINILKFANLGRNTLYRAYSHICDAQFTNQLLSILINKFLFWMGHILISWNSQTLCGTSFI